MNESEFQVLASMTPFLVAGHSETPEKELLIALDTSTFETPAHWGVILADMLAFITAAYVEEGLDPTTTRIAILEIFAAEVANPTDKPRPVEAGA